MLHMAPRTLHRRLEAEGTSYRAIVDQVRHRLALQHLKTRTISLQERPISGVPPSAGKGSHRTPCVPPNNTLTTALPSQR